MSWPNTCNFRLTRASGTARGDSQGAQPPEAGAEAPPPPPQSAAAARSVASHRHLRRYGAPRSGGRPFPSAAPTAAARTGLLLVPEPSPSAAHLHSPQQVGGLRTGGRLRGPQPLTHRRRRPRRCVPIQQQRHGGRGQQPRSQLQHPAPRRHHAPAPGGSAGCSTSASRPAACRSAAAGPEARCRRERGGERSPSAGAVIWPGGGIRPQLRGRPRPGRAALSGSRPPPCPGSRACRLPRRLPGRLEMPERLKPNKPARYLKRAGCPGP